MFDPFLAGNKTHLSRTVRYRTVRPVSDLKHRGTRSGGMCLVLDMLYVFHDPNPGRGRSGSHDLNPTSPETERVKDLSLREQDQTTT